MLFRFAVKFDTPSPRFGRLFLFFTIRRFFLTFRVYFGKM